LLAVGQPDNTRHRQAAKPMPIGRGKRGLL
jgi:hypothetical protein